MQGHQFRQVCNNLGDRENHRGGVAGLHAFAIHIQCHIKRLRVGYLVCGDKPRANRPKRVAGFALGPLAGQFCLKMPLGHVIRNAIAGYIIQCGVNTDIFAAFANDHAKLYLPVAMLRMARQHHRVVRTDNRRIGFHEQDRMFGNSHAGLGRMIGIIQPDAQELANRTNTRANPDTGIHRRQV